MVHVSATSCVLLALMVSQTAARTYDVEAEAMRLYGEDVASVLRKFRRSTEYMVLLKDKVEELIDFFAEVYLDVTRRAKENTLELQVLKQCYGSERSVARTFSEAPATPERKGALMLDEYVARKSMLSAHYKRCLRDTSYELAGQTIHEIIDAMGPVDNAWYSTRLPFGGDPGPVKTTAEKDHSHKIATTAPPYDSPTARPTSKRPPGETPVDETLRMYKLQKT